MLENELEDSVNEEVFFGSVTERELKISCKLQKRKTEILNFCKKNIENEEEIPALNYSQNENGSPTESSFPCKRDISESNVRQTETPKYSVMSRNVLDKSPSFSKSSTDEETLSNLPSTPVVAICPKEATVSQVNHSPLPSDMTFSLEKLSLNNFISFNNGNINSENENSLPEDLCDLLLSSMGEVCLPIQSTSLHFNSLDYNGHKVCEEDSVQQEMNLCQKYCQYEGETNASEEIAVKDLSKEKHMDKKLSPGTETDQQHVISPVFEQNISSLHTPIIDENSTADISTNSFEFTKEMSSNEQATPKVIPDKYPTKARISLSFSKDEKYYEGNFRQHFSVDSNILNLQKCPETDIIEPEKKNYFDSLELIDITLDGDDAIKDYNCGQLEPSGDLKEEYSLLSTNNGSSYVSDGSHNYGVLFSNSEEAQQSSLPIDQDVLTDSLDNERDFNDTIEEVDLLLKYGVAYFEEGKKTNQTEKISDIPKITLNDESIINPRNESVSSINSASFLPPCNSTHRIDESYESITKHPTFTVVGTPKKSPANGPPPTKPPRKAKCSVGSQDLHKDILFKTPKKSSLTPSKRKRIPTYTLKPKIKSPRTPYNTPSFKANNYLSTPNNRLTTAKPASAVSLFKPKSKLASAYQPRPFLTPQIKSANCRLLREYKSPLSCESETLHRKIRGLSIVSPVAKYLQDNPPPPLIITVKPKNKINQKVIENERSPTTVDILKDSNKTNSSNNLKKKALLPSHSYTTSKTQILEKENTNTRREILTNNPPTSITKHIGRFKVPKNRSPSKQRTYSIKDESMMEVSVCENKSATHSHTLQ